MFVLESLSRVLLYEQLQAQIERNIVLGIFEEGQQLPSVRQLALDLGINPNTVQKSYRELERRGVIVSLGGRGSFIAKDRAVQDKLRAASAARLRTGVAEALQAGLSAEEVRAAITAALAELPEINGGTLHD